MGFSAQVLYSLCRASRACFRRKILTGQRWLEWQISSSAEWEWWSFIETLNEVLTVCAHVWLYDEWVTVCDYLHSANMWAFLKERYTDPRLWWLQYLMTTLWHLTTAACRGQNEAMQGQTRVFLASTLVKKSIKNKYNVLKQLSQQVWLSVMPISVRRASKIWANLNPYLGTARCCQCRLYVFAFAITAFTLDAEENVILWSMSKLLCQCCHCVPLEGTENKQQAGQFPSAGVTPQPWHFHLHNQKFCTASQKHIVHT